ncbi:MAG: ribosome biogenesis GTP-binding protein YihA/YsxC [Lentisphaeraceae bacterium]|nr:ribosome biogenesis GTP-binding protein YihA/YsxC [Lentisphaeraceae bacterium]
MHAEYITSIGDVKQLPNLLKGHMFSGRPEERVIFVGRSNVGKSSLLNGITKQNIAQVSKQAGKTRKINFFYSYVLKKVIVDLPGYGFAKRTANERKLWAELIQAYVTEDEYICKALVLCDSRHGPTESDIEAIEFLNQLNLKVVLVMTKIDQLKNQKMRAARRKEVKKILEENPQLIYDKVFWTSTKDFKSFKDLVLHIRDSKIED